MRKINIELIKAEEKLRSKVEEEIKANAKNIIKDFVTNMPRIAFEASNGVGRIFFELKEYENAENNIAFILANIKKYYTITEDVRRLEQKCVTYYFKYDCSDDGEEEVYCE